VTAIVKRIEEWTGPLTDTQVALVGQFVAATADYPQSAHDQRQRRQRELVRGDSAPPADELRSLFLAWGSSGRRRGAGATSSRSSCSASTARSPPASARVVERLTGYAEDARVLARGA
jgi:hypothetical protein